MLVQTGVTICTRTYALGMGNLNEDYLLNLDIEMMLKSNLLF